MQWTEVEAKDPIYLNLGGAEFHDPVPGYEGYVSVDFDPRDDGWSVRHDLTQRIPLPDNSVSRIHTEDFLEHLPREDIAAVLAECYRLLAPGGIMRIGVPDYNNPKDRPYLNKGHDERYPGHATLTNYPLMQELIAASPFERHQFYQYWDGDVFVENPIDYSLGMIRRCPDHYPKCRRRGAAAHVKGTVRDFFFRLSRGFSVSEAEMAIQKGRRLHVTSLTVDLFKE